MRSVQVPHLWHILPHYYPSTTICLATVNQHFFINFYPHWHYSILSPKMRQLQVIKWTLLFYSLFVAYQNITSVYGKHMGSNDTHCTLDSIVVVTPTDLAGIWLVFCIVAESHQWEKTYLLIAVHFSFTSNALVGCYEYKGDLLIRSIQTSWSASTSFWGISSCYVSTSSFVASRLVPIALARYLLGYCVLLIKAFEGEAFMFSFEMF